jgi:hypothetical protein
MFAEFRRCPQFVSTGGALVLALVATGCAPGTGSLSGTVSFKGQPLPGGLVVVASADGRVAEGKIAEDGAYSIADAPTGELKVKVVTQPAISGMGSPNPMARGVHREPGSRPEPFAPLGKYVAIPDRYRNADRSGLTCTVLKGQQNKYDIPLTP